MRVRTLPPHGDRARYARGCRCPDCTESSRIYHKRLRERRLPPRRVDSTGTSRRLQALLALGWPFATLGDILGTTDRWPSLLANRPTPTVTCGTAAQVEAVYDRLSHLPGPSAKARTWAAKHGWAPPLAWDNIDDPAAEPWRADSGDPEEIVDGIAVERALRGSRVKLTRLEQHHAVHVGRRRGMKIHQVAVALHLSGRHAKTLWYRPLTDTAAEQVAA